MRKKLFYLILSVGLLSSCNNVIDKKVSIETAKDDIKEIKEKYKDEYTDDDFEAISNELTGNVFRTFLAKGEDAAKGVKFEKTYKEYLDEAKKIRLEKEKLAEAAKKAEADKIKKMEKALTVTMYGKEYVPKNYDSGRFDDYNNFKYAIKNKSNKEIKAIGISFTVFNALGEQIGEGFGMDFTDDRIPANGDYKGNAAFSVNQFNNDDNILKNAKFEDLTFKFNVSKIVYSDGSILE